MCFFFSLSKIVSNPSAKFCFTKKNELNKQTEEIAMNTNGKSVLFFSDEFIHFCCCCFSDTEPFADALSTAELAVLVVGLLLAVLISICVSLRCYRERKRQRKAERVSG